MKINMELPLEAPHQNVRAVRMKDQAARRPSAGSGHAQCVDDQLPSHAFARRKAYHLTA
jgi:hypothetical protein